MQGNSQEQAPTQQSCTLAVVLLGMFFLVCGTCAIGGFYWVMRNPFLTTVPVTEHDFNTNAERIDYLNQILPIILPHSSTVITFHQEGFQDWWLNAEIQIPQEDIDALIDSLPPLDEVEPLHFRRNVGPDHLDIQMDRDTGIILIEFIEA